MDELLFPGTQLSVVPAQPHATRRTAWTCVGLHRDGEAIFLHTHSTNSVARHLIDSGRVPGLEGWNIDAAEVRVGHSRFDFRLRKGSQRLWLEVKSCTLFGNGSAMFPDAVTERGRRHLLELARLRREERVRPVVLFVVHSLRPRWFLPDYHTDLEFSRALLSVRRQVRVLPVAVGWNPKFTLQDETRLLPIPWAHTEREAIDGGGYLLLLHVPHNQSLEVGSLGTCELEAGWYVYVGSAVTGLDARLRRHVRRRKRFHWHIDRLRDIADRVVPLPVRSSRRIECDLAASVAQLYRSTIPRFGSSDCDCPAHLFRAGADPLNDPAFHGVLQQARMPRPTR